MKRVIVDRFGGPEVLRVVEDEVPQPAPGEVRARVLAAGVSLTDAQLRAGTYLGVPRPPFTPGYELVGVVNDVGSGEVRQERTYKTGCSCGMQSRPARERGIALDGHIGNPRI